MMKTRKLICGLVCAFMLISFSATAAFALPGEVTGEADRTTREITLSDGTKTGVTETRILLPTGTVYNTAGYDKEAYFVEFDLANTNLSVEAINNGEHLVDVSTVKSAVENYNSAHQGQTVLAAMNGDLWMTAVHSNEGITKSLLRVSRGVMISDGEIWASQEIGMENAEATNAEKGTTAAPKAAFGVTSQNQPLVGVPKISISVKNDTSGESFVADGINRLPADDSVIVYNYRCFTTNYALNDSYEIEIESDNTAFTIDGKVEGTVKAIYQSGSTSRPEIGKNSIIITVRGDKIDSVKDKFSVGDKVSFDCGITDDIGNTELWQDVREAIGGHIILFSEDKPYTSLGGNNEYPVALIGIKDDGKVMFCTLTSAESGKYIGANYSTLTKFVREAGYNSVFFLDGGGSTTMVTLEEGTYSVRNHCSDAGGEPRSVISSVAVVWNDEKVCEKQGSLDYIEQAVDLSSFPAQYIPADLMPEIVSGANACGLSYNAQENSFDMTVTQTTNDPYAALNYSTISPISADDYKYIVIKAKTNVEKSTTLMLYYYTGTAQGATPGMTKSVSIDGSGEWKYYIVDMSSVSNWTGTINGIRLDIFDSINSEAGDMFSFGGIALCKTEDEAQSVANGELPDGAYESYDKYKEEMTPETEEPTTENNTEQPTETAGETDTTAAQETLTAEDTQAPSESPEESTTEPGAQNEGCKSATGVGAVLVLTAGFSGFLAIRKKHSR